MKKTIFVIERNGAIVSFRRNCADVVWNFETEKKAQECAEVGDIVKPMDIFIAWNENEI